MPQDAEERPVVTVEVLVPSERAAECLARRRAAVAVEAWWPGAGGPELWEVPVEVLQDAAQVPVGRKSPIEHREGTMGGDCFGGPCTWR